MNRQEVTTQISDAAQTIQERAGNIRGMTGEQLKNLGSKMVGPGLLEQKAWYQRPRNIILGTGTLAVAGLAVVRPIRERAGSTIKGAYGIIRGRTEDSARYQEIHESATPAEAAYPIETPAAQPHEAASDQLQSADASLARSAPIAAAPFESRQDSH